MNHFLPALSSEVVHRVVEILKFFNTRTCQLVLGAGAMQVVFSLELIHEYPSRSLFGKGSATCMLLHMNSFLCMVLFYPSLFFSFN